MRKLLLVVIGACSLLSACSPSVHIQDACHDKYIWLPRGIVLSKCNYTITGTNAMLHLEFSLQEE